MADSPGRLPKQPTRDLWAAAFRRCLQWVVVAGGGRKIGHSASELRKYVLGIPEAVARLEQQYLSMQEKLAQLGPAARELLERGERLTDLGNGKHSVEASIERAAGLIETALARLAGTQESLSELIIALREADRGIQALLRTEKALSDAIAPLDYVQVMLRIEASRLPADQQQIFVDLTGEIATVSARAKRSSAGNLEAITRIEGFLRSALEGVEKRHEDRQSALESRRKEISRVLRQLGDKIRRNAGREIEALSGTAALAKDVNRAVMALQTQDIVAQRLEHVREGLLEAVAGARGFKRSRRLADAVMSKAVLRVETEQIVSVGEDMRRAQQEINEAIQAVQRHLAPFQKNCPALREFSEVSASVHATVQVLLESFAGTRELMSEAAASIQDVEELVGPCESMAGGVSNAVREISYLMRVIALNAQIHAIRIGGGTGLEVLAAHTSGISTATAEIVTQTGDEVATLAALLQSGQNRVRILNSEFQAVQQQMNDDAAGEEAVLRDFRESALGEMRELTSAMRKARDASEGLLSNADCSSVLSLLAEMRTEATSLEGLLSRGMRSTPAELSGLTAGLRSRYTMARERVAHDRALGDDVGSVTQTAAPAEALTATMAVDGIELF